MSDELTEAVVGELKKAAQLVAARVQIGAWNDATYEDPDSIADRIIALVRADERRRIREQLLSLNIYDLADAARVSEVPVPYRVLKAALAAIGLTEETPS